MSDQNTEEQPPLPVKSRSEVLRDVLVFQLKLLVDGIKDLILSPLSLIAGLIGVAIGRNPGGLFYRILRSGKRVEHWIDLFGAASEADSEDTTSSARRTGQDFDTLVDRLQTSLLDPDARARLSEESKKQLDTIVKKIRGNDAS